MEYLRGCIAKYLERSAELDERFKLDLAEHTFNFLDQLEERYMWFSERYQDKFDSDFLDRIYRADRRKYSRILEDFDKESLVRLEVENEKRRKLARTFTWCAMDFEDRFMKNCLLNKRRYASCELDKKSRLIQEIIEEIRQRNLSLLKLDKPENREPDRVLQSPSIVEHAQMQIHTDT